MTKDSFQEIIMLFTLRGSIYRLVCHAEGSSGTSPVRERSHLQNSFVSLHLHFGTGFVLSRKHFSTRKNSELRMCTVRIILEFFLQRHSFWYQFYTRMKAFWDVLCGAKLFWVYRCTRQKIFWEWFCMRRSASRRLIQVKGNILELVLFAGRQFFGGLIRQRETIRD